jgi:hypothetical protein
MPGVAMKANAPGPVIGIALERLDNGAGTILAFVSRSYFTPAGEITALQQEQESLAGQIEKRTPDQATGKQPVPGHLQVLLDSDADDRARFSIFRDGDAGSLRSEVFRVDEEGNVFAHGSFRPASMDVAEYFPVTEPVEPGDLLTVDDRSTDGYRQADAAADSRVLGIVAVEPGVLLGAGLTRIAGADPGLAVELEQARESGDSAEEARIWSELEERFHRTHAPVALSGTVLCKVDAGYGAIRRGDLLTSSPTPGHAMRADDPLPGTIVGKALGTLESGTGTIRVLVMLR